ncbi:lysocardiolipin and lysophospholipid acyltransferase [Nematocida major]|uniref:lysocardiolipin and lysophospholipid acyltransferase n=1 Tax=Nematocida major TaxID=1912982 RepID=UPI0020084DBF|nr:lysocardiolipin and lysophospholipid acyltransferase [Nematocida major]KAH9387397.1 lysocardiolipin and lysophospholipid acyltransferase [Nematocida major]
MSRLESFGGFSLGVFGLFFLLFPLMGGMLLLEIGIFPVAIFSRDLAAGIMGGYCRLIMRACMWMARTGNPHAVEIVGFSGANSGTFSKNESIIVVSNHICSFDTVLLFMVSDRLGKSPRFVAKSGLRWIPVVGWGMLLSNYLFVKRAWREDSARMRRWCQNQNSAVSLILYPEGSRYTEKKREKSAEFSRRKNLPVLENVLFPRTKGYSLCVETLPSPPFTSVLNVTVVYLVNGVKKDPPSLWRTLLCRVPGTFKVVLERARIDEALKKENYLLEKFQEKDRMIEGYKNR